MTTFRAGESSTDAHSPRHSVRDRLQRQLGGSYAISRELSGGGSASVFLATEIALDRPVVLKALPPELAAGVDVERFRREIAFAARLQHPHLVPLLSAGASPEGDGRGDASGSGTQAAGDPERAIPWFSMPYVQGQTLRERLLSGRPLQLPEVIRLLREIASALAYAHARGIVHRDIKPENVLLCDGVAMVTDFGVAKALDDASDDALRTGRRVTTVSMALGTPAYMAPEQVNSAKLVDHKADIYALGCMAYELVAGDPPLARTSLRATMAAQLSETPAPLSDRRKDVPPALGDVIMQCLEKDPHRRPHSASVIVKTIDAIQAQPVSTGEYASAANDAVFPSSFPRTSPVVPTRRPRMMAIVLGAVAMAAVGVLLWRVF